LIKYLQKLCEKKIASKDHLLLLLTCLIQIEVSIV
jgi:hypothetical protein